MSVPSRENPPNHRPSPARRLGVSLLWSQIGRIFDITLSLLLSIVIVRALGTQEYAIYVVAWAVIGVGALISSLGCGETLTRYIPLFRLESETDATALTQRLGVERVLLGALVASVTWIAAGLLASLTHTPALQQLGGLIALLMFGQTAQEPLTAYLTATLRMRDYAFVRAVAQVINLGVVLLLFATWGSQVWIALVATLVSLLLSIVLCLWKIPNLLIPTAQPVELGIARRFGIYVWLTNLATFGLASRIDVLLIAALLRDSTQISFYNLAVLVLERLYSVFTGWTAVLMPAAADAHARAGKVGIARSFDLYMKVNLVMLLPPFVFAAAAAHPLITTLFGGAFAPASIFLTAVALFNLCSVLAGANVCNPLLYVADQQRMLLGLRIAAGALNIALDVALIPPLGAMGAVIATGTSNLSAHLIELGLLRRTVKIGYPVAVAFKLSAACLLAVLPTLLVPYIGWVSLLLEGALFAAIFLFVIRLTRLLSPGDYALVAQALPRLQPIFNWFRVA